MIRAVIFDCDGTIFNPGDAVEGDVLGIKRAYDELGIDASIPTKKELLARFGYPYPDFLIGIIPDEHFERASPLAFRYTIEETARLVREGKGNLFNGSLKVLSELKNRGIKLGLATNGTKEYLSAVVETHGLKKVFDVSMSFEQVKGDKGDLVKEELRLMQVSPKRAFMVGDRKSDIDAAAKAGCRCVGVTYGFGSIEELNGADFIIKDITDLVDLAENDN